MSTTTPYRSATGVREAEGANDLFRRIAVIVAIAGTIVVNALANILPFNGLETGEISDMFNVYFVPAGYVFSIWGLIYLGLVGYAVYQALPGQRNSLLLRDLAWLVVLSCVANAGWLFLWHYLQFGWTLVVMLVLLGTLIAIYLRIGRERDSLNRGARWLVAAPFSIYLGWISVATIANATDVLDWLGWDGGGIPPQWWAVIMLAVATALGLYFALRLRDSLYVAVLVWAFIGIAVAQSDAQTVYVAALAAAALLAVAVGYQLFTSAQREPQRSR